MHTLKGFEGYNKADKSGSKKSSNDILYPLETGKLPI
jgi:hypothetical protein